MPNVIDELNEALVQAGKIPSDIKWLTIRQCRYDNKNPIALPPTGGEAGYLQALFLFTDVEYDDGWGTQELDGIVVFTDCSWLERGEYDGSEWWEYRTTPSITDYL